MHFVLKFNVGCTPSNYGASFFQNLVLTVVANNIGLETQGLGHASQSLSEISNPQIHRFLMTSVGSHVIWQGYEFIILWTVGASLCHHVYLLLVKIILEDLTQIWSYDYFMTWKDAIWSSWGFASNFIKFLREY